MEKRKHTRNPVSTSIKIKKSNSTQEDSILEIGKTINISKSGVYFIVKKFIPVLTKVEGVLTYPLFEPNNSIIHFVGSVVRSEPVRKRKEVSEYKIAVFFQEVRLEEV